MALYAHKTCFTDDTLCVSELKTLVRRVLLSELRSISRKKTELERRYQADQWLGTNSEYCSAICMMLDEFNIYRFSVQKVMFDQVVTDPKIVNKLNGKKLSMRREPVHD